MTFDEIMEALEGYGNEQTKKVLTKHGAKEPFFGVKVGDLKKIVKKVKKNHDLALELYKTGNSDAMYLAGLIADEKQMTKALLQEWIEQAYWYMLSEYTVPWITAESDYGYELALEWIESSVETIAAAGWATLTCLTSIKQDEDLDLEKLEALLERAANEVHEAQNRVRYAMNNYIIGIGINVVSLTEKAQSLGEKVGKVTVNMGGTACKVPLAAPYIQKAIDKNRTGKKRKSARC